MAKLKSSTVETLKGFNIVAKDEESAIKILIKKLADNEVEGVEECSLEDLIEMYSVFFDEEVEEKSVKKSKKAVVEEDDEDEDDEEDEKSAKKSSNKKVKKVIDENEDEDDDEEEEKPVKKVMKKTSKKIVEDEEDEEEVEEPKKKKVVKVEKTTSGDRFDPENKDHKKALNAFKELFGELEVEFKLNSSGVSVFLPLRNVKKLMVRLCNTRVVDGELRGDLDLVAFKGIEEAEKYLDCELKTYSPVVCFIPKVSVGELEDILTEKIFAIMAKKLKGVDEKLGKNREKLEEKMKVLVKSSKKAVVEDEDDDDTEEEEDEKPVKKSLSKKPVKKVVEEDEEEEEEEEEEKSAKKSKLTLKGKGKK